MKKTKTLLALLLALALAVACGLTAFAAEPEGMVGECGADAEAALTKSLQFPDGTAIPTGGMNFVFSVTGNSGESDHTPPAIGDVTISFGSGDLTATSNPLTGFTRTTVSGVTTLSKESGSLFAGKTWPGSGLYVYNIVEKVSSSYTGGADEVLDYSEAEYKVNVYVQQCLDDECADYLEYYVSAIGAVKLTLDDGDPGDDALKLDPTPGSLRVDSELSEMEFTNSYVKRTVPDPNEDDPTTLTISKLTTGAYRDETEYFDFVLTLALPVVGGIDLAEEGFDGPFEVKVFEDGVDVTEDHPDATLDEIEFIAGSNNFQLKHGQSLKIYGLAYGTTYTISEIDPTNYTPSALITRGGAVGSASGGALSTTKTMPDQLVAGGGANSAAYTNARNDITLEGLNINDIPFIGMIALALAAGLFLVAAKTRKAKKSYNH